MKRLALALLILGAAFGLSGTARAATDHQASILTNQLPGPYFVGGSCTSTNAAPIVIPLNDSITWTNCDDTQHTVTFNQFGSERLNPGATYTHIFDVPGQYAYKCSIHPNMTAQVTVTAPPPTQPPATQPSTTTTAPTTTTLAASTTTQSTLDINGVFDDATTSSSSTSSTTDTTLDELAGGADDDGGGKGAVIVVLLLAIAGVGGGGFYALRRMRTT